MGRHTRPWPLCASISLFGLIQSATSLSPVTFPPSGEWDGIDGTWSSFELRLGTPAQDVRVFPSWESYQTWTVLPMGCPTYATMEACIGGRGGLFNPNSSTTYTEKGLFSTTIEQNLGLTADAQYGFDSVGLGASGPQVDNTTIVAVETFDFYIGFFGLDPKPTNYSSFSESSPSYMALMQEQDLIPSISFGYTAGAYYRNKLGSLTLGGYDAARYVANDVEFAFAADNDAYTVVAIQTITTPATGTSHGPTQLLPSPIYALIDTTVAELWLPIEACQAFESAFGLVLDDTTALYLVDSELHTALLARNASVTFTLGKETGGGSQVVVTLPYAAFDLTASPPYLSLTSSSLYFPLRRAQNSSQYTLGRTFMQEAYISVDYGRSTFNLSQVDWTSTSSNVVGITYANTPHIIGTTASGSSTPLKPAVIAGVAVGTFAVLALSAVVLVRYFRRRSHRRRTLTSHSDRRSSSGDRMFGIAVGSDRASNTSGDSATLCYAGHGGSRIYAKYQESDSGRSPMSEDKLLSPYPASSIGSPQTPFSGRSGRGYYSFDGKTAISPSSPVSGSRGGSSLPPATPAKDPSPTVIWAGEKDGGQIYEMPGSMPIVAQADGRALNSTRTTIVTSPVGALSPGSQRQRSGEMVVARPLVADERVTSPETAKTPGVGAVYPPRRSSQPLYGYGDDEEYRSPAF